MRGWGWMMVLAVSLAGVAWADKVAAPRVDVSTRTQAAISKASAQCESGTASIRADVKNTGAAKAVFTVALTVTYAGECTKTVKPKTCGGLCPGKCVAHAPDKDVQEALGDVELAPGATATVSKLGLKLGFKKAVLAVQDKSKPQPVSKTLPGRDLKPCPIR